MSQNIFSTHSHTNSFSQLVDRAGRHWEARRQAAASLRNLEPRISLAFTIALEREVGTLGTAVAIETGKLLGWHVYDHELLEKIANEMGLRTALLNSVDERQQSRLLELVEGFATGFTNSDARAFVSESDYVFHLVETIHALGIHGECVIVGRGAGFILPSETTLRVRLVGPVKARIAALSRKFGISENEAARQVHTVDRERTNFVRAHFQMDPTDPRNYDLVLNTPRLSQAQCAELIVETLHRLQAAGNEKTSVGPSL